MALLLLLPACRQALEYKQRILAALPPSGQPFTPLMTLYLTDKTPPDEVQLAKEAGVVAFKMYPAGGWAGRQVGHPETRGALGQAVRWGMLRHGGP